MKYHQESKNVIITARRLGDLRVSQINHIVITIKYVTFSLKRVGVKGNSDNVTECDIFKGFPSLDEPSLQKLIILVWALNLARILINGRSKNCEKLDHYPQVLRSR